MFLTNIVLGGIVLLFGRRLFWAFVAIAGFLVGVQVAAIVLATQPAWMQILAGLGLGIVGAVVAVFAQRLGFALAGFYAVGYLSMAAGEAVLPGSSLLVWFIVGGLLGAIIAALVMDQAIIVLSSFFGAAAVVSELMLAPLVALLAFAGLTILGIAFQSRSLRKAHDDADGTNANPERTA